MYSKLFKLCIGMLVFSMIQLSYEEPINYEESYNKIKHLGDLLYQSHPGLAGKNQQSNSNDGPIETTNENGYDEHDMKVVEMLKHMYLTALRELVSKAKAHGEYKRDHFMNSEDLINKFSNSKRVNRNMFSSGLQGVWGVPGRK